MVRESIESNLIFNLMLPENLSSLKGSNCAVITPMHEVGT